MDTNSFRNVHYTRKEALLITEEKKHECNTKALRIVETLLEDKVNAEWLLENVKHIAQSHLQDAIEERAISKICGYPICSKRLGLIPRQQFHISTKTNKVYDITERKHFCSNYCYKAAQYLKGQLLTSPVWLRDIEEIPNFHLLPCSSPGGELGKEIELGHEPITLLESEKSISEPVKSESSATDQNTIIETQEKEVASKNETKSCAESEKSSNCNFQNKPNIPNTNLCMVVEKQTGNCSVNKDDTKASEDNSTVSIDVKTKEQSRSENNPKRQNKTTLKSKKEKQTYGQINFVSRIEKCLKAWFTFDSFIYIYGNEKAMEMMKDKKECLKEYYKGVKQTLWEPEKQAKYLAICKKLNLMELEEESFETASDKNKSKPLPNYEELKKDAETMELKVREFYQGKPIEKLNRCTKGNEIDDISSIPLVELHAQNALRRRIVLDRLQHVLPDLLRTFGMASRDVSSDVRCLVATFSLGADNIMFKPAEWNLIGIIIMKMLSIKDPKLKTLMKTQLAQKYTSMMLMGFQLDGGYLDRLITWFADIDYLLNKTYVDL